jgi:hypothetical protein
LQFFSMTAENASSWKNSPWKLAIFFYDRREHANYGNYIHSQHVY